MNSFQMTVALRVLNAASSYTKPLDEDVELLMNWADPQDRHLPPDELACLIVEAELASRDNPKNAIAKVSDSLTGIRQRRSDQQST